MSSSFNGSIKDGIKLSIGFQIGTVIGHCVKSIFKFIQMLIALYIMFQFGDAIKADQATRSHHSAIVHTFNK